MSRHYLLFLNGPATPALVERMRALDPGDPFVHVVMPSLGDGDRTRAELKTASAALKEAGFEIHADYGTVASMRQQGWPFEGLILAAAPGSPAEWVSITDDAIDPDFPLLASA